MKLMTKKLVKRFKEVGWQENEDDQLIIAKYFDPTGPGIYYLTDYDHATKDCNWYFSKANISYDGMASFSFQEIEKYKGLFDLGMQRDLNFSEIRTDHLFGGEVSEVNYQKTTIVGIAAKDANVQKSTKGSHNHTTFTLGVSDRSGKSTYFPIAVFGNLGEIAAKYVTEGSQLLVEGRIQFSDIGRMNVIADRLQFGTHSSPIQPLRKTE